MKPLLIAALLVLLVVCQNNNNGNQTKTNPTITSNNATNGSNGTNGTNNTGATPTVNNTNKTDNEKKDNGTKRTPEQRKQSLRDKLKKLFTFAKARAYQMPSPLFRNLAVGYKIRENVGQLPPQSKITSSMSLDGVQLKTRLGGRATYGRSVPKEKSNPRLARTSDKEVIVSLDNIGEEDLRNIDFALQFLFGDAGFLVKNGDMWEIIFKTPKLKDAKWDLRMKATKTRWRLLILATNDTKLFNTMELGNNTRYISKPDNIKNNSNDTNNNTNANVKNNTKTKSDAITSTNATTNATNRTTGINGTNNGTNGSNGTTTNGTNGTKGSNPQPPSKRRLQEQKDNDKQGENGKTNGKTPRKVMIMRRGLIVDVFLKRTGRPAGVKSFSNNIFSPLGSPRRGNKTNSLTKKK